MRKRSYAAPLLASTLLFFGHTLAAPAADLPTPRLTAVQGKVSVWRPGAEGWRAAKAHAPLGAGDLLYVGHAASVEIHLGPRAFARARAQTEIALLRHEPHYLKFALADGQAAFDVRALPRGLRLEVDTPHAAFVIDRPGYYRLRVDGETTQFATRGKGLVLVVGTTGGTVLRAGEATLVTAGAPASLEVGAVPERDDWDDWNAERFVSARSEGHIPVAWASDERERTDAWRSGGPPEDRRAAAGEQSKRLPGAGHRASAAPHGSLPAEDKPPLPVVAHPGRWIFADGAWAWMTAPLVAAAGWATPAASVVLPPTLVWGAPLRLASGTAAQRRTETSAAPGDHGDLAEAILLDHPRYRPAPLRAPRASPSRPARRARSAAFDATGGLTGAPAAPPPNEPAPPGRRRPGGEAAGPRRGKRDRRRRKPAHACAA